MKARIDLLDGGCMQNTLRSYSDDEHEKFLAKTIKHMFSYAWVNCADQFASEGTTDKLTKQRDGMGLPYIYKCLSPAKVRKYNK